ncbi:MAG: trimethylamine methyltransferase family protein [Anaerolineales bacterium]
MEPLKFLSDDDIKAITATMRIMQEIGIIWTHKPSLDILTDAGCTIKDNRICFPPDLVMDSIAKANKRPVICGRNGTVNELGGGNLYFITRRCARCVRRAHRRTSHRDGEDCINATRVLDALPNCNTVTPFFTPPDVPNEMMALHMFRHTLSHTTKPVQGPGIQFGHEAKFAVEMAAVVGAPAHELTLSSPRASPLTMHDVAAQAVMDMAHAGVIHSIPRAHWRRDLTDDDHRQSRATKRRNSRASRFGAINQSRMRGRLLRTTRDAGAAHRTHLGGVELGISSAATVQSWTFLRVRR